MGERFWLTEAQMGRIRPFFPKSRGRKRVDDRRVLSGRRRISKQSGRLFSRRTFTFSAMG